MTSAHIRVATLGDVLTHGYGIDAWCTGCETGRPVDVTRLAMRLGLGWSFVGRRIPLVCSGCGGRDVYTTIHPPLPVGPIAHSSG